MARNEAPITTSQVLTLMHNDTHCHNIWLVLFDRYVIHFAFLNGTPYMKLKVRYQALYLAFSELSLNLLYSYFQNITSLTKMGSWKAIESLNEWMPKSYSEKNIIVFSHSKTMYKQNSVPKIKGWKLMFFSWMYLIKLGCWGCWRRFLTCVYFDAASRRGRSKNQPT